MTSGSNRMLTTKQLTRFQKMVRATVSTIVPKNAQKHSVDSYVEAYNCKPPPLFMIIVSLAEVRKITLVTNFAQTVKRGPALHGKKYPLTLPNPQNLERTWGGYQHTE
jgi:hypothetical protein